MAKIDIIEHGVKVGEQEGEWYGIVQFCPGCIEDVVNSEIEFTEPVCISKVTIEECDNLEVDGEIRYNEVFRNRGKVLL